MQFSESRRINGPHLLLPEGGAAIEVDADPDEDLSPFLEAVVRLAPGLGAPVVRRRGRSASVAYACPPDQRLLTAEILDAAARGDATVPPVPGEPDPALVAAIAATTTRWFLDDDGLTIGTGRGAHTWARGAWPSPDEVRRCGAFDVPLVLVTGTNGKTTTARLLARIAAASGRVAALTSSDGATIGDAWIVRGDCTGSATARSVLRDARVELAILEVARGGLMRRGLVCGHADAAAITNISGDHLGEWGLTTVEDLAAAKAVCVRATRPGAIVVRPVADAALDAVWPEAAEGRITHTFGDGGTACVVDGWLVLPTGPLTRIEDIPISLGGRAAFNVQNALAASLLANALGIGAEAIRAGLEGFQPDANDSLGRSNIARIAVPGGEADVLVDFAHNPVALRAIAALARRWGAPRTLLVTGIAGDRDDAFVHDFAAEVAEMRPDAVWLKELPRYRRGRPPGQIRALLRADLQAAGMRSDAIADAEEELGAVQQALAAARPGDLVILLVHEDVQVVYEYLTRHGPGSRTP